MDRKRPVLGGSVRFPQYLGWSWTGFGPRLPILGAKNRTELDLRTLMSPHPQPPSNERPNRLPSAMGLSLQL